MNDQPTQDLATRAFYKRVLDEFAAVRNQQAATRQDLAEIRSETAATRQDIADVRTEIAEIRSQQAAIAKNIAILDQRISSLDQRLTSFEERVDARLRETRPIWEAVQEQLRKIAGKFDLVLNDLYEVRLDVRGHDRRLTELENKAA